MRAMKTAAVVLAILLMAVTVTAVAGEPAHVLVCNDDGVDAPGIAAIAGVLAADPAYRVTVVAPAEQQSVTGHGLVTRHEVAVKAHPPVAGSTAWAVDGTPATVARIAITALLAEDPPDLVVSGINRGENDGLGAWTSGTVAVAREAAYYGIPAMAVSLQLNWADPQPDFEGAAHLAKPVIDAVRAEGLPEGVYLNVNVPIDTKAVRGYRVVRMGLDRSAEARYVPVREDEDGTRWYMSRWQPPRETEPGRDSHALAGGWVTIVPLGLDQTAEEALLLLEQFQLPEPPVGLEEAPGD
jgi:5'-nucleotidase